MKDSGLNRRASSAALALTVLALPLIVLSACSEGDEGNADKGNDATPQNSLWPDIDAPVVGAIYFSTDKGYPPTAAIFNDQSCWNLTRIVPLWTIESVSTNSVSLQVSTDALGMAHLPLINERQNFAKLAFSSFEPGDRWYGVSPDRALELVSQGSWIEVSELNVGSFRTFAAPPLRPSAQYKMVDFERNVVCRFTALDSQLPNPSMRCHRRLEGIQIGYWMPNEARARVEYWTDFFTDFVMNLACDAQPK